MAAFLDNPLFLSVAFHPRSAVQGTSTFKRAIDGLIPVPGTDIQIGYRFYPLCPANETTPVFVYFHGNAEIAADADSIVRLLAKIQVNWVGVDFRGYGWSTGRPLLSTLLSDAEAVAEAIPNVLREYGYGACPLLAFGRSIGSTCAVHIASKYPHLFRGIVVESGLTVLTELPMVQQLSMMIPNGDQILSSIPDIFQQREKLSRCTLPLLVIHGEEDDIAPIQQGQDLYNASASAVKRFARFPNAGHNDLLHLYAAEYFVAVQKFVELALGVAPSETLSSDPPTNPEPSVLERAEQLMEQGLFGDAVECITSELRSSRASISQEMKCTLCLARARCFFQLGRYDDCVEDCSLILNMRSDHLDALTLRMKCYWRQGMHSFATRDGMMLARWYREHEPNLSPKVIDTIIAVAMVGEPMRR